MNNNMVKILFGGVAVYFLYKWYEQYQSGLVPTGATPNSPVAATGQTTNSSQANVGLTPSPVADIRTLMLVEKAKLSLGDMLTYDQWNYVYHQPTVRGVYGPAWEDAVKDGRDRQMTMSVDEFLGLGRAAGLRGIRSFGMGAPIHAGAFERAMKTTIN